MIPYPITVAYFAPIVLSSVPRSFKSLQSAKQVNAIYSINKRDVISDVEIEENSGKILSFRIDTSLFPNCAKEVEFTVQIDRNHALRTGRNDTYAKWKYQMETAHA